MSRDKPEVHERCTVLRQELKIWEKDFAAANGGRKADREDIKANATIALKYKEYNGLRDILSGKIRPPASPIAPRKRRAAANVSQTPIKASHRMATTPTKHAQPEQFTVNKTPSSARQLFTPVKRTTIGPTPQKDGRVLGLFDLLPAETPSKTQRTVLGDIANNITCTPSKHDGTLELELTMSGRARGSRTPTSTGKRFLLDSFVTPRKRKLGDEGTPSSSAKHLATPSFLRRDTQPLDAVAEEAESLELVRPWKRRVLGRSLSSMIHELRQQEENRLDEELDIMREMEQGDTMPEPRNGNMPKIQVEDSQAAMPLGPDGQDDSDDEKVDQEEDAGALHRNSQPRKVWKKRGQKRQTKRVIMRPVKTKPKSQPDAASSDHGQGDDTSVAETQVPNANAGDAIPDEHPADNMRELSDDESGSDYHDDDDEVPTQPRSQPKPADTPAPNKQKSSAAKEGAVKKAARKISAQAHANFRKLKIKNKNSKAKGRGRFGRR